MKTESRYSEWRVGWRVVLASFACYGTGIGMLMTTSSLFINPMQQDLGWSKSVATLISVIAPLQALANPLAGALSDRWGSRRVVLLGLVLLGLSFLGLAAAPPSVFLIYALAIFIGVIGPMGSTPPISKCVAGWFPTQTGSAFGVTFIGTSVIALVAMPAVSWSIHQFGWRSGFLTLAGFTLIVGLPPAIAWFREAPASMRSSRTAGEPDTQVAPDGATLGNAVRDWRFWSLLVTLFLTGIPAGGFLAQLQPILAEKSFGIVAATSLGMVYAIGSITGKIGAGVLFDRFWSWGVAACLLVLAGLGSALLLDLAIAIPLGVIALAVFLTAVGQGTASDLIAYFPLRVFGMRAFSQIVGIMTMSLVLGAAAGSLSFAKIFDLYQSYDGAILFGTGCYIVSGLMILSIGGVSGARSKYRPGFQQ